MSNQADAPTKKEIQAARRMARNMAALGGPDLTRMSDAEVVEHCRQVSERMAIISRAACVSAEEATKSLQAVGRAIGSASRVRTR